MSPIDLWDREGSKTNQKEVTYYLNEHKLNADKKNECQPIFLRQYISNILLIKHEKVELGGAKL